MSRPNPTQKCDVWRSIDLIRTELITVTLQHFWVKTIGCTCQRLKIRGMVEYYDYLTASTNHMEVPSFFPPNESTFIT
jgi:hypothetical protein